MTFEEREIAHSRMKLVPYVFLVLVIFGFSLGGMVFVSSGSGRSARNSIYAKNASTITADLGDGLALTFTNPQTASRLRSLDANHDQKIDADDLPLEKLRGEILSILEETSSLDRIKTGKKDLQEFFRQFYEKRKNGNASNACPRSDEDVLFQVSALNALAQGDYDGHFSFGDLREKGDFGLGTFVGIDGEMMEENGEAFQFRPDGTMSRVSNETSTPFSVVTPFRTDDVFVLGSSAWTYPELSRAIDAFLLDKSLFYAIKVTGKFAYVKTRSIPQQQKPYAPLAALVEHQPIQEWHDQEGTLIGFWLPDFMKGINATGYHFHYLSKDRSAGGHVLALTADPSESLRVAVDTTCGLEILIP